MDQTDARPENTILSLFDPARIPEGGLNSADAVAAYLAPIRELPQEVMVVIGVDSHHTPVTTSIVGVGTVNSVAVTGRDVFRDLIRYNAAGFILAHNHPSGDPLPSKQDDTMTEDSALMGTLLGIELLDHLILTARARYSYADGGRLPRLRKR